MQDSFLHKGKRKQLIAYLQRAGISDEKVLTAMNEVPRHLFIESIFEDFAYEDRAFPILAKQTISHPSTVAEQTELLELKEKVTEIVTAQKNDNTELLMMMSDLKAEIDKIQNEVTEVKKDSLPKPIVNNSIVGTTATNNLTNVITLSKGRFSNN